MDAFTDNPGWLIGYIITIVVVLVVVALVVPILRLAYSIGNEAKIQPGCVLDASATTGASVCTHEIAVQT